MGDATAARSTSPTTSGGTSATTRVITSEWGTPNMVENGVNPELLLGGQYGHQLHVWDLKRRRHLQTLDLGAEQQMVLELRPAHDPTRRTASSAWSSRLKDLSASILLWHREPDGSLGAEKVIEIPAEPADPDQLPPALKPFGAVPPLVTDIDLEPGRPFPVRLLLGHGRVEAVRRLRPVHTRADRLGAHRRDRRQLAAPGRRAPLNGGPQMVEVSRDGRRVYLTNSLYRSWDAQFYPEGIQGWVAKLDAGADGGLRARPRLLRRVPRASGRTRCACRAATRRRTRTASRTRPDMDTLPLVTLALLGAYHGLNPAMGWLFAVGLGMQDRNRRSVLRALPPIAAGHELAIAAGRRCSWSASGAVADPRHLALVGGGGADRVRHLPLLAPRAHPRWTTMRVTRKELTWWSFLMSSAHGAGLMVAPVLLGVGAAEPAQAHAGHFHADSGDTMGVTDAALAITVHVGAMLAVMAVVALRRLPEARPDVPAPGLAELGSVLGGRVHRRRGGDARWREPPDARRPRGGRAARGRGSRCRSWAASAWLPRSSAAMIASCWTADRSIRSGSVM